VGGSRASIKLTSSFSPPFAVTAFRRSLFESSFVLVLNSQCAMHSRVSHGSFSSHSIVLSRNSHFAAFSHPVGGNYGSVRGLVLASPVCGVAATAKLDGWLNLIEWRRWDRAGDSV